MMRILLVILVFVAALTLTLTVLESRAVDQVKGQTQRSIRVVQTAGPTSQ
jgi:sensor domain CHASE-containing protein